MELSHYSEHPIEKVLPRKQIASNTNFKPRGLWVSVDGEDDWKHWCECENFRPECLKYHYRVVLAPEANILHLATVESILAFTDQYASKAFNLSAYNHFIDWPLLETKYQGIVIAPYQWGLRMLEKTFWYYPWDCASGCIWDAAAIQSLELI